MPSEKQRCAAAPMAMAMPTHAHPWPPTPTHALRGLTGTHRIARGAAPTDGFACGLLQVLRSSPHAEGLGTPIVLACGQEVRCAARPIPARIALLLADRACAQRGADSGARILAAGLFLASLVRDSLIFTQTQVR